MARICWMMWVVALLMGAGSAVTAAEPASGVVKFVSDPDGATVSVDGRVRGVTPLLLELSPGPHKIIVALAGFPPKKERVTILSGRVSVSRYVFDSKLPKTGIRIHEFRRGGLDSGPGSVTIVTDPPGLTVQMNRTTVTKSTPVSFDIHSGIYKLRIKQDGSVLLEKTVVVQPGRSLELEYTVRKRRTIDETDPWN